MAFAADGRLFVATTTSGGITVISPDGQVLTEIGMDEHATNCIFDGSVLYVTATKVPDIEASQRTGSFWRVQTDATGLADSRALAAVRPDAWADVRGPAANASRVAHAAARGAGSASGWPGSQPARGAGCREKLGQLRRLRG